MAISIAASVFSQSPAPSPKTEAKVVDSLSAADLQTILPLLKSNFINPQALSDVELNRSTVEGLLTRLSHGVMLLPNRQSPALAEPAASFYSEVLDGHVGYLRLGTFNTANLQAMDKSLADFASKKVDAIIIDLRASSVPDDFAAAAEFAKRFCPKGKPLFTLRKPGARQDRVFMSDRQPVFQGLITVLADGNTSGAAEVLAGTLRVYEKGLIIGQTTAGRAVEYSDLPLPSGKILRVAVADAIVPGERPLFPDGVNPDLPVEMSMVDKRQIFQRSVEKGMEPFVYESERPHMNEASLLAGTNPELDAAEAAQRRRERPEKAALHDVVLQRALDLVTSLEVYQKR
ncbi:MAG: S41 family peptidase [Chthoniobacterales bacterium]